MVQWVKNPNATAWITEEAWDRSPAQHSGLKDPALPQLWCRSQLWLGFNPWPRNFHMPWVGPLTKKKSKERKSRKAAILTKV